MTKPKPKKRATRHPAAPKPPAAHPASVTDATRNDVPTPLPRPKPPVPPAPVAAKAKRDRPIAELSDSEILKLTGHGRFGPGIVGEEIHQRSVAILKGSAGGKLGRAIVEHDFAARETKAGEIARQTRAAQRPTATRADRVETGEDAGDPIVDDEPVVDDGEILGAVDPGNLDDSRNPWSFVTLSGAKQLAMTASVSYIPKVQRRDLIAQLQAAGVTPPPAPSADDLRQSDAEDDRAERLTD